MSESEEESSNNPIERFVKRYNEQSRDYAERSSQEEGELHSGIAAQVTNEASHILSGTHRELPEPTIPSALEILRAKYQDAIDNRSNNLLNPLRAQAYEQIISELSTYSRTGLFPEEVEARARKGHVQSLEDPKSQQAAEEAIRKSKSPHSRMVNYLNTILKK